MNDIKTIKSKEGYSITIDDIKVLKYYEPIKLLHKVVGLYNEGIITMEELKYTFVLVLDLVEEVQLKPLNNKIIRPY